MFHDLKDQDLLCPEGICSGQARQAGSCRMGVPDCNEQARRSDHLILNLAWSESLRRSVAFQWFFTAFSVRPDSSLAISAHLKECI